MHQSVKGFMKNLEKYKATFKTSLNIEDDKFNDNINYNEIEEWDLIGHMTLIAALEESLKFQ